MEAVKKAASGAVESIRNSPLFRRKFGTYQKAATRSDSEEGEGERGERGEVPQPLSPEKDRTPFVQGFYFQVDYLGRQEVDAGCAQDHGCTDEAVGQLCREGSNGVEGGVSIRVTTSNLRVKRNSDKEVMFEFPLFRVSYCGTDRRQKEVFSFVAKETDGRFYCFVFRSASKEKAYAIVLTVAKAFYLAYQILQEQQGNFPPTPERDTLFEPQRPDDTKVSPLRPTIPLPEEGHQAESTDQASNVATPPAPSLRVTRPSITSSDSDSIVASVDEDFTRLAKARSNPDILRTTLKNDDITGDSMALVQLHTDPASTATTPFSSPQPSPPSSPHSSPHTTPHGSQENLDKV